MHKIMQICFNSSNARLGDPMPSVGNCQDSSSILNKASDMTNVFSGGRDKNKEFKEQAWPMTYAHEDTQKIVMLKNMKSKACYWRIEADFSYKHLRL